jgi:hypothetical protein
MFQLYARAQLVRVCSSASKIGSAARSSTGIGAAIAIGAQVYRYRRHFAGRYNLSSYRFSLGATSVMVYKFARMA